jgi:hypothetical protein
MTIEFPVATLEKLDICENTELTKRKNHVCFDKDPSRHTQASSGCHAELFIDDCVTDLFDEIFCGQEVTIYLDHRPTSDADYSDLIYKFFRDSKLPIFDVREVALQVRMCDLFDEFYGYEDSWEEGYPWSMEPFYEIEKHLNTLLSEKCRVKVRGFHRVDPDDLARIFIKWCPYDEFLKEYSLEPGEGTFYVEFDNEEGVPKDEN